MKITLAGIEFDELREFSKFVNDLDLLGLVQLRDPIKDKKGNILIKGENELLSDCAYNYTYSKATREEVTKYFPHEFEIDAHGGNDAGHVCPITN